MSAAVNTPQTAARRTPVHDALDALGAQWRTINGAEFAVSLREEPAGDEPVPVALCDLSGLEKLGVKGSGAAEWLSNADTKVPADIYESTPLTGGGLIVRLGTDEFLLEDEIGATIVGQLSDRLGSGTQQVFRVEHQEATFLVAGARALDVMSQTCGLDLRDPVAGRVVLTRIAGVSAILLPQSIREETGFRLWVDPSYAHYLWHQLATIAESLGGRVVGAGRFFPERLA